MVGRCNKHIDIWLKMRKKIAQQKAPPSLHVDRAFVYYTRLFNNHV